MLRTVLRLAALAVAGAAAMAAGPASAAEIQKLMQMCPGQKLCPWFKAVVAPPQGWIEDREFGSAHFITALFPEKAKPGPQGSMMYVQVSLHRDEQTLEQNIAQNQGIWRQKEPQVKITPLPDVARTGGGMPFKVFLYENPAHPKQAFEMSAFGIEPQADGSHYIITVVATGASRKTIDDSRAAYETILGQL